MALQASGTITAAQIGAQVAITAGQTVSLQATNVRGMSGTSAGTQVSFSTFYSKGLTGTLVTESIAADSITIDAVGTLSNGGTPIHTWFAATGSYSPTGLHEAYFELVSGGSISGTVTNTWVSSARTWNIDGDCVANIYFRQTGNAATQVQAFALTIDT